ncbi:hypothetical protein COBT_000630 [Conglomerata obtusa]
MLFIWYIHSYCSSITEKHIPTHRKLFVGQLFITDNENSNLIYSEILEDYVDYFLEKLRSYETLDLEKEKNNRFTYKVIETSDILTSIFDIKDGASISDVIRISNAKYGFQIKFPFESIPQNDYVRIFYIFARIHSILYSYIKLLIKSSILPRDKANTNSEIEKKYFLNSEFLTKIVSTTHFLYEAVNTLKNLHIYKTNYKNEFFSEKIVQKQIRELMRNLLRSYINYINNGWFSSILNANLIHKKKAATKNPLYKNRHINPFIPKLNLIKNISDNQSNINQEFMDLRSFSYSFQHVDLICLGLHERLKLGINETIEMYVDPDCTYNMIRLLDILFFSIDYCREDINLGIDELQARYVQNAQLVFQYYFNISDFKTFCNVIEETKNNSNNGSKNDSKNNKKNDLKLRFIICTKKEEILEFYYNLFLQKFPKNNKNFTKHKTLIIEFLKIGYIFTRKLFLSGYKEMFPKSEYVYKTIEYSGTKHENIKISCENIKNVFIKCSVKKTYILLLEKFTKIMEIYYDDLIQTSKILALEKKFKIEDSIYLYKNVLLSGDLIEQTQKDGTSEKVFLKKHIELFDHSSMQTTRSNQNDVIYTGNSTNRMFIQNKTREEPVRTAFSVEKNAPLHAIGDSNAVKIKSKFESNSVKDIATVGNAEDTQLKAIDNSDTPMANEKSNEKKTSKTTKKKEKLAPIDPIDNEQLPTPSAYQKSTLDDEIIAVTLDKQAKLINETNNEDTIVDLETKEYESGSTSNCQKNISLESDEDIINEQTPTESIHEPKKKVTFDDIARYHIYEDDYTIKEDLNGHSNIKFEFDLTKNGELGHKNGVNVDQSSTASLDIDSNKIFLGIMQDLIYDEIEFKPVQNIENKAMLKLYEPKTETEVNLGCRPKQRIRYVGSNCGKIYKCNDKDDKKLTAEKQHKKNTKQESQQLYDADKCDDIKQERRVQPNNVYDSYNPHKVKQVKILINHERLLGIKNGNELKKDQIVATDKLINSECPNFEVDNIKRHEPNTDENDQKTTNVSDPKNNDLICNHDNKAYNHDTVSNKKSKLIEKYIKEIKSMSNIEFKKQVRINLTNVKCYKGIDKRFFLQSKNYIIKRTGKKNPGIFSSYNATKTGHIGKNRKNKLDIVGYQNKYSDDESTDECIENFSSNDESTEECIKNFSLNDESTDECIKNFSSNDEENIANNEHFRFDKCHKAQVSDQEDYIYSRTFTNRTRWQIKEFIPQKQNIYEQANETSSCFQNSTHTGNKNDLIKKLNINHQPPLKYKNTNHNQIPIKKLLNPIDSIHACHKIDENFDDNAPNLYYEDIQQFNDMYLISKGWDEKLNSDNYKENTNDAFITGEKQQMNEHATPIERVAQNKIKRSDSKKSSLYNPDNLNIKDPLGSEVNYEMMRDYLQNHQYEKTFINLQRQEHVQMPSEEWQDYHTPYNASLGSQQMFMQPYLQNCPTQNYSNITAIQNISPENTVINADPFIPHDENALDELPRPLTSFYTPINSLEAATISNHDTIQVREIKAQHPIITLKIPLDLNSRNFLVTTPNNTSNDTNTISIQPPLVETNLMQLPQV